MEKQVKQKLENYYKFFENFDYQQPDSNAFQLDCNVENLDNDWGEGWHDDIDNIFITLNDELGKAMDFIKKQDLKEDFIKFKQDN